MPITWTQMKCLVEEQSLSDPQRAKLSERAWQGVEAGLQHLTGVGYNFEIAPRGTVAREQEESAAPAKLGIGEAQALVAAKSNPMSDKFDALVKDRVN